MQCPAQHTPPGFDATISGRRAGSRHDALLAPLAPAFGKRAAGEERLKAEAERPAGTRSRARAGDELAQTFWASEGTRSGISRNDSARLGTPFALPLRDLEPNLIAHPQMGKRRPSHRVLVEVDIAAVGGFDEAVSIIAKQLLDLAVGRRAVRLHLVALPTHVVFELAPDGCKRVANRHVYTSCA